MGNVLTGDFDLVVEMPVPRVDRVLAAIHGQELFPHSFVLRIDDGEWKDPRHTPIAEPAVTPAAGRAAFIGAARAARRIAGPQVEARAAVRATAYATLLGRAHPIDVVRFDDAAWLPHTGVRATAEVQLSTPTLTLPTDPEGRRITVTFRFMAHMRCDPGSAPLPDFLHGDLSISASATQIVVQDGRRLAIDFSTIDFLGDDIEVGFVPVAGTNSASWPITRIERAIANALAFGFVSPCRQIDLPPVVKAVAVRTLPSGATPAAALLVNLTDRPTSDAARASVTSTFTGANDDFAIAVGRDYLVPLMTERAAAELAGFIASMNAPLPEADRRADSFRVTITVCDRPRLDVTYRIAFSSAPSVELEDPFFGFPGTIRLSVGVHAVREEESIFWAPLPGGTIDFTITQRIRLKVADGKVVVDENLPEPVITPDDVFQKDRLRDAVKDWRGGLLEPLRAQIRELVDQFDLGVVLRALELTAATTSYSAVDVQQAGVILRGVMNVGALRGGATVTDVAPLDRSGTPHVLLNAFATWIPGGTVDSYTWTRIDPQKTVTAPHQFMTEIEDDSTGPSGWCLTVTGTRIGAAGQVQPTYRSACMYVLPGLGLLPKAGRMAIAVGSAAAAAADAFVDPWAAGVASAEASTLVHFADSASRDGLRALEEFQARARHLALATVVVLPHQADGHPDAHDERARGLLVTKDFGDEWSRALEVRERPATVLVDRTGKVRWRGHGRRLDPEELEHVVREHRVARGPIPRRALRLRVLEGERAPDFHFELDEGHRIHLQRLRGRPVILVFWTSWAEPSIALLRELAAGDGDAEPAPVVLAIADGDDPVAARAAFERIGGHARLVPDPERTVARAYGVHCWPTAVWLDAEGRVETVQMGRGRHDHPAATAV